MCFELKKKKMTVCKNEPICMEMYTTTMFNHVLCK